jgi:tetratricopeptide (TPR) repeat protein
MLLALAGCQSTPQQTQPAEPGPADLATLERHLAEHRYQTLIQLLEDTKAQEDYPSAAFYYLAQAYRLRGNDGDELLAARAYRRTIHTAPDFAPAYRDLGILQMKANRKQKSLQNLTTYLELEPAATDRPQIERYIQLISRK